MIDFIIYSISFFVTVPLIATWIIYKITKKLYNQKLKAVHKAANWTTLLYIIAVTILLTIVFNRQMIGIVSALLLCIFTGIVFIQWKSETEIIFRKAFKVFWRLCFLLFLFLYCFLLPIGIIQRIFFL
ncbi:DUF3397 family protein [Virgibacillus sp. C22-A2]|uniref:DUF3397 family protein n=1 Tax=Virgibacillus tibetensis TaxID=3042313 RepID=A0ABU6KED2_9BACI|nr:DUF3397 family protein [Virgibacillus sp. C22-A2]